ALRPILPRPHPPARGRSRPLPHDRSCRVRRHRGGRRRGALSPAHRAALMATLLVHEAGPQTTVQDLGRRGSLRVGIPPSGPVDREAFVLANRIVGNAAGEAGLEDTLICPPYTISDRRRVDGLWTAGHGSVHVTL